MNVLTQVDHLVVAARSLAEGVAWCEQTLGVAPGPGGEHPLFGTHNRLLRIASEHFPRSYLEIIAINSEASSAGRKPGKRWFDLDSEALQARLGHSPRLIHFVARTPNLREAHSRLQRHGVDRGAMVQASRMTPSGLLQWQITVREDGQRLFQGALPTLIEWGETHPVDAMADVGLRLRDLNAQHPQSESLLQAFDAIGLRQVGVSAGQANLRAELQTPNGLVCLESMGV